MAAIAKPVKQIVLRLMSILFPVIGLRVISLTSKFEPISSSNDWDMNIWKSKMASIIKPAKPTYSVWSEGNIGVKTVI